jgi:CSLREA domain-containing protein
MEAKRARLLIVTAAIVAALPTAAQATTINVDTTADSVTDDASCSLREAVNSANNDSNVGEGDCEAGSGPDTIVIPAGTYTLAGAAGDNANATGDLDVQNLTGAGPSNENGDLTIAGAGDGAGGTVIDADDLDRALDLRPDASSGLDVGIEDLKVVDGKVAGPTDDGGGILMSDDNGSLTVRRITIDSSEAPHWGGAISWENSTNGDGAPLEIIDSELTNNSAARGGAVWTNNGGFSGGGGSVSIGGATRIVRSTLTGNTATVRGGAIYLKGSADGGGLAGLSVLNSTIDDNDSGTGGGAIAMGVSQVQLYVYFSTITGNSTALMNTAGGIQTDDATQAVFFRGTILAGNTAAGSATDVNCFKVNGGSFTGNATSNGYNVESANTCDFAEPGGGTDNVNEPSVGLGALLENGGFTRTRALQTGSPAIDFVPTSACFDFETPSSPAVTDDQRGSARPSGSACDAGAFENQDPDGDGVSGSGDNCPNVSNPSQANNDGDAQGDACDLDDDNDGVPDGSDNCQFAANASQANNDVDSQGDACDSDDDNDLVSDGTDNCELIANSDQVNSDGDAQGDACDLDDDNDGVIDASDNCQTTANADQANLDGDAAGDACDVDGDGDGAADPADNCATTANAGQADLDGDGLGDACDADDDGDGVGDDADSCATAAGGVTGCPAATGALTLKYSASNERFRGTLTSSAAACLPNRAVSIFRKKKGDDPKVAGATTDPGGAYKASKRAKDGKYYAVVDQALVARSADCARAQSSTAKAG